MGRAGSGGQVIALPAGTASLRRRLLSNYVRTPPAIRHTEQQFLSDIQEIELLAPGCHISHASQHLAQSKYNFLTNIVCCILDLGEKSHYIFEITSSFDRLLAFHCCFIYFF